MHLVFPKIRMSRQVLPTNVVPIHYDLKITPGLNNDFKFTGSVKILLQVVEPTSTIVCNARDLIIESAMVGTEQGVVVVDELNHTVKFEFKIEIPVSKIVLELKFQGRHNDSMVGFYRSGYKDALGAEKFMLVTQFEAVDCRRCFPSWDEPSLKATFAISLLVPKHITALSNMNIETETSIIVDGQELKQVQFATSPKMSTYLVAMAVGEFDFVEKIAYPKLPLDAKPIVCRTYTLPGQSHLGQFANDTCVSTLEFFSEYFDLAYPLPKMDMIAVPDFAAGAMVILLLIFRRIGGW